MRVGLQVYTVRNHLKENPSKTLEQVVKAGYKAIEFANHFADKEVLLLAYMRQVTEEFTAVLTQRLAAEPLHLASALHVLGRGDALHGLERRLQLLHLSSSISKTSPAA